MKKKALVATALLSSMITFAQQPASGDDEVLKNKKGYEILPKAGDIALGFNTIPIIDLFLGSMNHVTPYAGAANTVQYTSNLNNQITGKYFLDAKTAVRVRFGINTIGGSIVNQVQDANAMASAVLGTQDDIDAASLLKVDDKMKFQKTNLLLSIGYEKRRGYRRLVGFYGAELGFGNTSSSQHATYGNTFSDTHVAQYTNNFNTGTIATQNPTTAGRQIRVLDTRSRGGLRLGLRGFIGVEYFVFSKISIAAEYGFGYSFTTRRGAKSTQEVYNNGVNGPMVTIEDVNQDSSEKTRGFSVDNNNGSVFSMNNTLGGNTALSGGAGAITLLFHF